MSEYNREKEILEAIEASSVTLQKLHVAKSDLDSASTWGFLDILGGGMVSSFIKHSRMSDAKYHIEEARIALRNFSKELLDVSSNLEVDLEVNDFLSFTDVFMDNFVSDWLVQSHISQAQTQVIEAINQVQLIKEQLEHM